MLAELLEESQRMLGAVIVDLEAGRDHFYPAVELGAEFLDHLHVLQDLQPVGDGFVGVMVVVLERFGV